MSGIDLIAAERARQSEQEGYCAAHDAGHCCGELASAGAFYALCAAEQAKGWEGPFAVNPDIWPWDSESFKPKDAISNLVRAGALIAAEIDRLERSAAVPAKSTLTKTTINPAEPWPFPTFKS